MNATTEGPLTLGNFTGWLAAGERGLSSEAIVAHLTGQPVGSQWWRGRPNHPHDPSDFRRCQLLFSSVPLARLMFPTMRTASPEWARLVDAWDEIHDLIKSEVPDYLNSHDGSAPLSYRFMKRVINGGVTCADCDGTGRAEPCEKCKGSGRRSGGRCRARGCYRGFHLCGACLGDGYTVGGAS